MSSARPNDSTVEEMYEKQFIRSAEQFCVKITNNSAQAAMKKIKQAKTTIENGATGEVEPNVKHIAELIAASYKIWHTRDKVDRKFSTTEKKAAAVAIGVRKMQPKFKALETSLVQSKSKAYDATSSGELCRKSAEEAMHLENALKAVEVMRRKLESTQLKENDRSAELQRADAQMMDAKGAAEAAIGSPLGDYDREELERLTREGGDQKTGLSTRSAEITKQLDTHTQTRDALKVQLKGDHTAEDMQIPLDQLKERSQLIREANGTLQLAVEESAQQLAQKKELKKSKDQKVRRLQSEKGELSRQKNDREARIVNGTCKVSRQLIDSTLDEIRQVAKEKVKQRTRLHEAIAQLGTTLVKTEEELESLEDSVCNPLMTSTPTPQSRKRTAKEMAEFDDDE